MSQKYDGNITIEPKEKKYAELADNPALFTFAGTILRKKVNTIKYVSAERPNGQLKLGDYDVMITKDGSINTYTNELFVKQCESCGDDYSFCTREDYLKMQNFVAGYPKLDDVKLKLLLQNKYDTVASLIKKFKDSTSCKKGCKAESTRRKEAKMNICKICNTLYDTSTSGSSKYCGQDCQWEGEQQLKLKQSAAAMELHKEKQAAIIKKFVAGEIHGGTDKGELASYIREWLIKNSKGKCERCGFAKVNRHTGRPILDINHIDHNPYNHMFDNLEVVCPNCHREFTKPHTKNKGRDKRQELFNKGEMTIEEFKGNTVPSTKEAGGYKRTVLTEKINVV